MRSTTAQGRVDLVGAGPGDPGLLTLRGQRLLQAAEVVVYDHLVSARLLRGCAPGAALVYVGKEADRHTARQDVINALLIRHARAGRRVVRLKGGDPFVFGRGGEEALALAEAGIPYRIVPGISSAIGVPAYAGIPLTHRGMASSFTVITGHEDPDKGRSTIRWEALASSTDTLVCLMGVGKLAAIARRLMRAGKSPATPCAVVEWGTYPRQRTIAGTLRTIEALARRARLEPPAALIVGPVVRLRRRLAWFERQPLLGKRIVVTRALENSRALAEALTAMGAEVEELPAIELAPVEPAPQLRRLMDAAEKPDWVLFTSPEGLAWLLRLLKRVRKDIRWLAGCRLGAIGPKTAAALEASGLRVDFIPRQFRQEGMVRGLARRALRGQQAVIFSAEQSRDALARGLRRQGMYVTRIPVYRTRPPRALAAGLRRIVKRPVDVVTVTSASCVDHLVEALQAIGRGPLVRTWRFASIGPITSRRVRAHGGTVGVEARVSTIEGLVEAMARMKHV